MKPIGLKTKLFLDGGDPAETKQVIAALGWLDGQTTNPTLIAKHPAARERFEKGTKFTEEEIYDFYRSIVTELTNLIPNGSISIEVYADASTSADAMFKQGSAMFKWIPNAHIKYPTTTAGLEAAEQSIAAGHRVNLTLVFTQAQAAAVYAATKGAQRGDVFLSPFIGRLDDQGLNGMDLVKHTIEMYQPGDHHVQVLTASVRSYDHFMEALRLGSDIITAPAKLYLEWAAQGMPLPDASYQYDTKGLQPIEAASFDLTADWRSFDIHHPLTDAGLAKFAADWNALIQQDRL